MEEAWLGNTVYYTLLFDPQARSIVARCTDSLAVHYRIKVRLDITRSDAQWVIQSRLTGFGKKGIRTCRTMCAHNLLLLAIPWFSRRKTQNVISFNNARFRFDLPLIRHILIYMCLNSYRLIRVERAIEGVRGVAIAALDAGTLRLSGVKPWRSS